MDTAHEDIQGLRVELEELMSSGDCDNKSSIQKINGAEQLLAQFKIDMQRYKGLCRGYEIDMRTIWNLDAK